MPKAKMLAVVSAVLLAACQPNPVNGSIDSGANRLEVGMTIPQVAGIIGNAQLGSRASNAPNVQCMSYIYDEAIGAKFIHARFRDGSLISASDGHRAPC